ncbi:hypothetical protein Nhal_1069 [Nitrosococcus halophilus Nc 4]|uniref:Cytochrome c domain-containing protein n=1 Tax=Nitrosococcus halophilus (strain Nc4) TaxID=472759 RepID=D5BZ28_NITHN|nr:cytochrome c [Nitrosococcus halophilus]ADE14241.1 hypothetical protein Nhal_1069 [Nitrosococcus halophilus Nc 4]
MLKPKHLLLISTVIASSTALPLFAEQQHQHDAHRNLLGNLPADKVEEIRALENPLPKSPDAIAKGKKIYEGKGGCANCHGQTGAGDGPLAADLDPPPRNFQAHPTWLHHSEGEVFWVIKHGIPGSTMPSFNGILTDKEIWALLRFLPTLTATSEKGMKAEDQHQHEHDHGHSEPNTSEQDHEHNTHKEHGHQPEHGH